MSELRRFWFEFEDPPPTLGYGCGVTALSQSDAESLIQEQVLDGQPLPTVADVVEDVDVTTLDEGHVRPNMYPPNERGVWFPMTGSYR